MRWLILALQFYTRFSRPRLGDVTSQDVAQSLRYSALIGAGIGLLVAGVYAWSSRLFSSNLAALIAILTGIYLTRGLHEDGLADTVDGFSAGGGVAKILRVMKEPQIGSFGTIALLASVLVRVFALAEITPDLAWAALPLAHGLSRGVAVTLAQSLPYARHESGDGKIGEIPAFLTKKGLIVLLLTLVVILGASGIVIGLPLAAVLGILALSIRFLMMRELKSRLGGYTGDTLGALEQIIEVMVLLTLVACR